MNFQTEKICKECLKNDQSKPTHVYLCDAIKAFPKRKALNKQFLNAYYGQGTSQALWQILRCNVGKCSCSLKCSKCSKCSLKIHAFNNPSTQLYYQSFNEAISILVKIVIVRICFSHLAQGEKTSLKSVCFGSFRDTVIVYCTLLLCSATGKAQSQFFGSLVALQQSLDKVAFLLTNVRN